MPLAEISRSVRSGKSSSRASSAELAEKLDDPVSRPQRHRARRPVPALPRTDGRARSGRRRSGRSARDEDAGRLVRSPQRDARGRVLQGDRPREVGAGQAAPLVLADVRPLARGAQRAPRHADALHAGAARLQEVRQEGPHLPRGRVLLRLQPDGRRRRHDPPQRADRRPRRGRDRRRRLDLRLRQHLLPLPRRRGHPRRDARPDRDRRPRAGHLPRRRSLRGQGRPGRHRGLHGCGLQAGRARRDRRAAFRPSRSRKKSVKP